MSESTSVLKLKSLVEALELIADNDSWHPNAKQWRKIKDMILNLEEQPQTVAPQAVAPQAAPAAAPSPSLNDANTVHMEAPASAAPTARRPAVNPLEAGVVNFPEVPSQIPADAPRTPTSGGSALSPAPAPAPTPQSSSGNQDPNDLDSPPPSPGL